MELNEQILFLHGKGAAKKREIIKRMHQEKTKLYFLVKISEEQKISKVAAKKHLDQLIKLGYIEKINPKSKPIFLKLTEQGVNVAKKYSLY